MDTRCRRIIKIVRRGAGLLVIAGVLVFVVNLVVWSVQLAIRNETHSCLYCGDRIAAPSESCQQPLTGQIRVRLTWTPYVPPDWSPNTWRNRIMLADLIDYGYITTPWVYYDFTHDGGQTWVRFWDYDNERGGDSRLPWCSYFGSLDDQFLWVWTFRALAITRDGGYTWTIHDLPGRGWWSIPRTSTVVTFTDGLNGYYGQQYPQAGSESYVTTDGGITWARVDPDTD